MDKEFELKKDELVNIPIQGAGKIGEYVTKIINEFDTKEKGLQSLEININNPGIIIKFAYYDFESKEKESKNE